jgi:hypothetical protein
MDARKARRAVGSRKTRKNMRQAGPKTVNGRRVWPTHPGVLAARIRER